MKKININGTNHTIEADAENISYGNSNVKTTLDSLSASVENIQDELGTDDGDYSSGYGVVGAKKPAQVGFIKNVLDEFVNNSTSYHYDCLNFIHVSDSHGASIGGSYTLLDAVGSDFLFHTGDMLSDNWENDFEALKAKLLSTAKRCYVAIGNHDRVYQSDMTAVHDRFIAPLISRFGSGSTAQGLHEYTDDYIEDQSDVLTNKLTYYSFIKTVPCAFMPSTTHIDIRCIVLNEYETAVKQEGDSGATSWNKATSYNPVLCMSSDQINWFIAELQSAALAGQQVMIFTHQIISPISNIDVKWHDGDKKDSYNNGNFGADGTAIAQLVDAFMRNSTTTVTIGGQSYTYTKQGSASECPFVGWFVGHTHSDEQGWITAYPNQHVSVTTRAEGKSNSDYDHTIIPDSQFQDKWNYVKVNPLYRMVTIYRVGNQQTYHGTKRDILTYKY